MDLLSMDVLRCDGRTAESVHRPSNHIGHYIPAAVISVWAIVLFTSAAWRHALAERDPSSPPFIARTWEPLLPYLPSKRWQRISRAVPLDPLLKVIVTTIVVTVVYPYPQIVCPDGVRIGRIVGQHIVPWTHATYAAGFLAVGVTELAELVARLPPQTSTLAMVLAHLAAMVLFMYHQKHEILDQTVHGLIGYSYLLAAICGAMEAFAPSSFMPFAAKVYFHLAGGIWTGITGYIVFTGGLFWSPTFDGKPDIGPTMFAPVFFGIFLLGLFSFMLLLYAAMDLLAARRLRGRQGAAAVAAGSELRPGADGAEGFALLPMRPLLPTSGWKASGTEEDQGLLARGEGGALAEQPFPSAADQPGAGLEALGPERWRGVPVHGRMS